VTERIFNNDANLPLKSTTKKPIDSKRDIDGELAKWGITKVMWNWDLDNGQCEIVFQLPKDTFYDSDIPLGVRLKPPLVWEHRSKRSRKPPEIDWRLSVRLLYWYIHYQLAWVYASQSSPVVAFLPHIAVDREKSVKDVVIPQMEHLRALPTSDHDRAIPVDYELEE
jgi:hypothetical protein